MSFGFKFGLPPEADLVLDVRCLPNPFYVPELKHKTGLDQEVVDFVMGYPRRHRSCCAGMSTFCSLHCRSMSRKAKAS